MLECSRSVTTLRHSYGLPTLMKIILFMSFIIKIMENYISKTYASKFEGCTPEGTNWLVKTCDPASSKEIFMIPDSTNQDRVAIEIRTTMDVTYPGNGSTWDCRIGMTPQPLYLGFARTFNSAGTSPLSTLNVMNPTLDPNATTPQLAFSAICEKSRLLYQSLTTNLICTDLTNQGSAYAVQYERPYSEVTALYGGPHSLIRKVRLYDTNDNLTTDQMSTYKSAYVGSAKDGTYSVLKSSVATTKWIASEDTVLTGYTSALGPSDPFILENNLDALANEPYPYPNTLHWTGSSLALGEANQKPYNNLYGLVVYKGIDKAASIRLTFRMGIEMIVRPNSSYAPLLKSPEIIDLRAIQIHDEVISMIADAYPASYNDLGGFLKVLKNAAGFANKHIFPLVSSFVPGADKVTNVLKTIASPIGSMIDKKLNSIEAKRVDKLVKDVVSGKVKPNDVIKNVKK